MLDACSFQRGNSIYLRSGIFWSKWQKAIVGLPPDFLSNLLALAKFMRLSLMKAAHDDVVGAPRQEIRVAHRFRPTYALANVGHPSDFLRPLLRHKLLVVLTLTLWPLRYVFAMIILKSVPQGLKPSSTQSITARLKPCPSSRVVTEWREICAFARPTSASDSDAAREHLRLSAILRACTRYEQRRLRTRLLLPITGDGCLWMPDGRTTGFWM
jgi:hypothetical protein